jgi:hypothetical protein
MTDTTLGRKYHAVWKFRMPDPHECKFMVPRGATFLSVGVQTLPNSVESIVLWAAVNPNLPDEPRHFQAVFTGEDLPSNISGHVGTVTMANGIVWHVYELDS